MDRAFRKRLVVVHVAIALVIALSAATAVLALRTTRDQAARSKEIDERIALLDRLRAETRELAHSARRYLLTGDGKEHQRVLAIVHAMKKHRDQLQARATLAKGAVLEADLEEYIAALINATSTEDGEKDDAIVRLARFEERLMRIRNPLAMTFDEIVTQERASREALRSAQSLARGAQWAVLVASILGVVLAIGALFAVLRKLSPAAGASIVRTHGELVAAGTELRRPLAHIVSETSRMRRRPRDSVDAISLERIASDASRVDGMLVELLDVAALHTGALVLHREPCDAASLVDRAIKAQRDTAMEYGVRLRYEAQLSINVLADRERIRHVLDALLQIAITAAQPGTELVAHVAAAEGGVRFAIIEAGPGGDSQPPSELVLQMCSRVIEAHGGRLGIQASSISRTYWFTLPIEPSLHG